MKSLKIYRSTGAISKNLIENFSKLNKVIFPKTYIETLSENNWLKPQNESFDFVDFSKKPDTRDINFYGYEIESFLGSGTIVNAQNFDVYGYDKIIAIGFSANGDYICFDYRQNPDTDNPPIVLMYHDQYINDEYGNPKMAIVKIADDFDSFIDMLHE